MNLLLPIVLLFLPGIFLYFASKIMPRKSYQASLNSEYAALAAMLTLPLSFIIIAVFNQIWKASGAAPILFLNDLYAKAITDLSFLTGFITASLIASLLVSFLYTQFFLPRHRIIHE